MSGCEKYQELISCMLDGQLSGAEQAALDEHMRLCPQCAALYRAFSSLSGAVSSELEEAPAGLRDNIMSQLRRQELKRKNSLGLSKPMRQLLACAACVALLAVAAFSLRPMLERSDSTAAYGSSADTASDAAAARAVPEAAPADAPAEASDEAAPGGAASYSAPEEGNFRSMPPPEPVSSPDELLELLGGESCELTAEELAPYLSHVLSLSPEEQIYAYAYEGGLYYSFNGAEPVYLAACGADELETWLESGSGA